MLVLLSSVSLLAFAYARARRRRGCCVAWVVASALALATHYYAILAVVPEAVLVAVGAPRAAVGAGRGRRSSALCGLALIPLAIGQSGTGNAELDRAARRSGGGSARSCRSSRAGSTGRRRRCSSRWRSPCWCWPRCCWCPRSDGAARRGALVAGGIALAGLVLNLLLIAGRGRRPDHAQRARDLDAARRCSSPAGWRRRGARRVGCRGGAACCARSAWPRRSASPSTGTRAARLAGGGAGARDARAPAGGRAAILIQHYRDLLPLSLYVPGLHFMARRRRHRVRARRRVVHLAGERRLLLVGLGVQPVAVARAVVVSDRRLPRGVARATSCSSRSCGWSRRIRCA